MAIFDQDFVKFDGDQVTIKFTVTDSVDISTFRGWFGLSSATSYATLGSAASIEKYTGTPNSPSWTTPNAGAGCSGVTYIGSTGNQMDIYTDHIFVYIDYLDFEDGSTGNTLFPYNGGFGATGNYYYELVISENGDQCSSVVSAQGFLDMRQALFTSQQYRGVY